MQADVSAMLEAMLEQLPDSAPGWTIAAPAMQLTGSGSSKRRRMPESSRFGRGRRSIRTSFEVLREVLGPETVISTDAGNFYAVLVRTSLASNDRAPISAQHRARWATACPPPSEPGDRLDPICLLSRSRATEGS